jgi:hypothetical protein
MEPRLSDDPHPETAGRHEVAVVETLARRHARTLKDGAAIGGDRRGAVPPRLRQRRLDAALRHAGRGLPQADGRPRHDPGDLAERAGGARLDGGARQPRRRRLPRIRARPRPASPTRAGRTATTASPRPTAAMPRGRSRSPRCRAMPTPPAARPRAWPPRLARPRRRAGTRRRPRPARPLLRATRLSRRGSPATASRRRRRASSTPSSTPRSTSTCAGCPRFSAASPAAGPGPDLLPGRLQPAGLCGGRDDCAHLGLTFDVANNRVALEEPVLPPVLDEIHLRNLRLGAGSLDICVRRAGAGVTTAAVRREGDLGLLVAS